MSMPEACLPSFREFLPKALFKTCTRNLRLLQHRLLAMKSNRDDLGIACEGSDFRPRNVGVFINAVENGMFRLSIHRVFEHDSFGIHGYEIQER